MIPYEIHTVFFCEKESEKDKHSCWKNFYPGEYLDSTYVIDFDRLYEEGYRGIIFDIDNTLVAAWCTGRRAGMCFNLHI